MGFGQVLLSQLTLGNVCLGLGAYVVLQFLYQIIYYRFFHPLSVFPGPFWASVTRLWIAWHNLRETEVPTVRALAKQYGPVVRITPTLLLVNDPKKLPELYHRRVDKTSHYITGSFGETESLFNMRSHKTHATFRKHVAGPVSLPLGRRVDRTQPDTDRDMQYSFTNMKRMEPLVDARISDWQSRMSELYVRTGRPFDFAWWAVYLVYDIISEIGFGAPFGFIEKGEDVGGLIQGFHDGLPAFGLLARLYPFTNWVKSTFLKKYLVATPADDSGIGVLMRFRDSLITQRLRDIESGNKVERVDLLQTFLEARTEDGKPLDMEYIRAEVLLVLLAGADTTGTAFQALIQYLLANPEAYRRMMREIDQADSEKKLSAIPQYSEVIDHLPYYVACVKEAMRLCPSAPNIFPRYVADPGLDLYGKFVPAGCEVSCNPYIVQRDPELYGEDADEFRPERWLDPEQAKLYNKYYFGFGYGSRLCLGKDIAMMELYKGPLQFFRKHTLEVPDDKPAPRFCVKGGVGFWKDVWLSISKRS